MIDIEIVEMCFYFEFDFAYVFVDVVVITEQLLVVVYYIVPLTQTRDEQTQSRLDRDWPNRTDRFGFRTESTSSVSPIQFSILYLSVRFSVMV